MKIIVSHDVDHLCWSEHVFKDLYIPKHILRSLKWWLTGGAGFSDFYKSISKFGNNRLHRLPELIAFNKDHKVPATFFVGVNQGLGLSYTSAAARKISLWLARQGETVGVHGIDFDTQERVDAEFGTFRDFDTSPSFGVRMHYLRSDEKTLTLLSKAGYAYDSTVYGLETPTLVGKMWEFPISLMESFLWREAGLGKDKMLNAAKERLDKAQRLGLPYFVIDFHDVNFDDATSFFKTWYQSFIAYLVQQKFEFVNFHQAVNELNQHKTI